MRMAILLACTALLAACATSSEKAAQAPTSERQDRTVSDCYTVVLFDDFEIETPGTDVPPEYAAFVGEWVNGAWGGKWCHDLTIFSVSADGLVDLMDMHAPYEPWGQPASAFRRTGRINEEGELRFAHGTTQRSYRIVNGRLEAKRSGVSGEYAAQLKRPWDVPIPLPRPVRVASAS
ncbi:MAG: hypothetical protein AAF675_03340 [Pseudomonadota bacterium]